MILRDFTLSEAASEGDRATTGAVLRCVLRDALTKSATYDWVDDLLVTIKTLEAIGFNIMGEEGEKNENK